MSKDSRVRVWWETVILPTYLPAAPDKNPMFLEKRVYQGSSGKVYPLPFTDRIAEQATPRAWRAIWIENEYLSVMVLPELGGRIHVAQDRTNGYDFVYRQHVIKPALVGLAGPWISGGIEFNWPQHHRPATFLPVETRVEEHADGSQTIWCGDHDPMARMKGMHGVCLHPGRAYLELKVRVHNRTVLPQTFLWWANLAARVHEGYQSFFPPDVYYVADHAKRAMSEYPLCESDYYGVKYGERARSGIPPAEVPEHFVPPHARPGSSGPRYAPNDLSWYANIPVPTSYMCMGTQEDFFGGYDHFQEAGLVHVADHHIAPGKKQWTWGNHAFGYAWDRHLTDADGPYIELMAGVFTDNQPDFSHLQPGETKAWSQYWYPIQKIGPAQHANLDAAVSLGVTGRRARVGVSVTAQHAGALVCLEAGGRPLAQWRRKLAPDRPFVETIDLPVDVLATDLVFSVQDRQGRPLIRYQPRPAIQAPLPPPALEPDSPEAVASADELYFIGVHLEQYRHATRCPTLYWCEALRRDPLDARCNQAMGAWHLRRGEWEPAEIYLRRALQRLTSLNPNPRDGEASYLLGLCLRYRAQWGPPAANRDLWGEAEAAFQKAAWNQAWAAASYRALAELAGRRGQWPQALDFVERALRREPEALGARNLKAAFLLKLGWRAEAATLIDETLALDPLDAWAWWLKGFPPQGDLQSRLDLAHDLARAGFVEDAIQLLQRAKASQGDLPDQSLGTEPLVGYTLGWLHFLRGDRKQALECYRRAATLSPDYCFPARLEEMGILRHALALNPKDARAHYYLGNLYYDRRRHAEAIECWTDSVRLDPTNPVAWRNLGIGRFNFERRPTAAREAYEQAWKLNPSDARLLYERDQLWKRLRVSPARRLRELTAHLEVVRARDDLTLEYCALLNQTGRAEAALRVLEQRQFQPWEGGEGLALAQHTRARLALGRAALARGDAAGAADHFRRALTPPANLGETWHLLANRSQVHYWLGAALQAGGDTKSAQTQWRTAAEAEGDFQEMSICSFSESTYYSALAARQLGREAQAKALLKGLLQHGRTMAKTPARIDYFATSLPALLLFEEDLTHRKQIAALFLQAQAHLGLGHGPDARWRLRSVLEQEPSHAGAADLLAEWTGTR